MKFKSKDGSKWETLFSDKWEWRDASWKASERASERERNEG